MVQVWYLQVWSRCGASEIQSRKVNLDQLFACPNLEKSFAIFRNFISVNFFFQIRYDPVTIKNRRPQKTCQTGGHIYKCAGLRASEHAGNGRVHDRRNRHQATKYVGRCMWSSRCGPGVVAYQVWSRCGLASRCGPGVVSQVWSRCGMPGVVQVW